MLDMTDITNKKSIDINVQDEDGLTALAISAIAGNTKVVKLLLDKKVNINLISKDDKNTALHWAVMEGHTETVKILVENGADININVANKDGFTPLHLAAKGDKEEHTEIVKILLKNKADIHAVDNLGRTPPNLADFEGREDVAQIFEFTEGCSQKLLTAAFRGKLEAVKNMLAIMKNKDMNIDVRNEKNMTPLHMAAYKGHDDIVEILLKNGADINAQNKHGMAPLCMAILKRCTNTIKKLLELGKDNIDINIKDGSGGTPVDLAVKKGYNEIAVILKATKKEKEEEQKSPPSPKPKPLKRQLWIRI